MSNSQQQQHGPSVGVIVPTYNSPAPLKACLMGLVRQTCKPDAVYVADDGSKAETREVVESFADRLTVRHVWQEDDGFQLARIRNKAVALAEEDYLVLLDGDTVPHRRFIEDHLRVARPKRVVLGSRCCITDVSDESAFTPPGTLRLAALFVSGRVINDSRAFTVHFRNRCFGFAKGLRMPMPLVRPAELRDTHGGNFGCWRSDLLEINGFDEGFTGWGYEDRDTARRLTQIGCELKQLFFQAVCYHLDHPVNPPNEANLGLFEQARSTRCEKGIDQYLAPQQVHASADG
ncbi:glycosyltransferase family 2 protein [Phycisphaerales bacterium AB-hyl4]|uniref:Glycosyltransferase family 2 protein n=1 Tax=Natronomicrosphaera hydrolytica TaxID=3242702 RepID=A0ABV4U5J8_9BACT